MTKKALITGGAGFIGLHVARALLAEGYEVTLADSLSRGPKDSELDAVLAQGVRLTELDLTDPLAYEKIGTGYDEIYHLAGINGFKQFNEIPHEVLRVGILSTIHLLEWMRSGNGKPEAKLVFSSTNEVYVGALEAFGSLPELVTESVPVVIADITAARSSYAGSKIAAEMLVLNYACAYNLRISIARLHNIYGPRAGYQAMIPKMIARVAAHTDPFPIFGGSDRRTFCFIDDAVGAMQALASSNAADGKIYNVGSGEEITISELTLVLFKTIGWQPETIDEKPSPDGTAAYHAPDLSRIKNDVGWKPKVTLEEGLRKTVQWYLEHPQAA